MEHLCKVIAASQSQASVQRRGRQRKHRQHSLFTFITEPASQFFCNEVETVMVGREANEGEKKGRGDKRRKTNPLEM